MTTKRIRIKLIYNITKLVVVGAFLFSSLHLCGQNVLSDQRIVLPAHELTFNTLVDSIESQSDITVVYSSTQIKLEQLINFHDTDLSLETVVEQVKKDFGLHVFYLDDKLLFQANYKKLGEDSKVKAISGFVRDGNNLELLRGASIVLSSNEIGTTADEFGYFRLNLPLGSKEYTLHISYVGYETLEIEIKGGTDIQSDFLLSPKNNIEQILIFSKSIQDRQNHFSTRDRAFAKAIFLPAAFGDENSFDGLTRVPGIAKVNDLQSGVSIRGLPSTNTLYLIDGLPLYEPNHAFGTLPVLNNEMIRNIELNKQITELHYSGRLSGVINHHLVEGDLSGPKRVFGLSDHALLLHLEGPLQNNKTSYAINTRKSVMDLYVPPLLKRYSYFQESKIDFYDVSLKLTHRINPLHKLELFTFLSNDQIHFNNAKGLQQHAYDFEWSNRIIGLKWKAVLGDQWSHSLQLGSSNYFSLKQGEIITSDTSDKQLFYQSLAQARINNLILNQQLTYYHNNSVKFEGGINVNRHSIKPAIYKNLVDILPLEDPILENQSDSISWDMNLFASVLWEPSMFWTIKAGLGLNSLYTKENPYSSVLNPMLSITANLNSSSQLSASLQRLHQNIHEIQSNSIGISSGLWLQSSSELPPESMWQMSLDYRSFLRGGFFVETGLYYRYLDNMLTYTSPGDAYDPGFGNGAIFPVFSDAELIEDRVSRLEGKSYGWENTFGWQQQKHSFSMSYSFAHNHLILKEDAAKEAFPGNYSVKHAFNIDYHYVISSKWLGVMSWRFQSGTPYSLPQHAFQDIEGNWILGFSSRNEQKIPDQHSLKVGFTYNVHFKNTKVKVDFGIRNVYNQANPLFLYLSSDASKFFVNQVRGLPHRPFFSFKLEF